MLLKILTMLSLIGSAAASQATTLTAPQEAADSSAPQTYEIRRLYDEKQELKNKLWLQEIIVEEQEKVAEMYFEEMIFIKQHLNQKERTLSYHVNMFDRYFQTLAAELDRLPNDTAIAERQKSIAACYLEAAAKLKKVRVVRNAMIKEMDAINNQLNMLTDRYNYKE